MTKTSCFALDLYTFSNSKDNLFQGKTTCFGIMKAYEGKHFAFIRAIYWLLKPYAGYEGKLNFKQNLSATCRRFVNNEAYSPWSNGDGAKMIYLSDTRILWLRIHIIRKKSNSALKLNNYAALATPYYKSSLKSMLYFGALVLSNYFKSLNFHKYNYMLKQSPERATLQTCHPAGVALFYRL